MIPLGDGLPDRLEHVAELFHGRDNPALYEFDLGCDRDPEVLLDGEEPVDVLDRLRGVGVFAEQVVFSRDGVEDGGEVRRETGAGGEEACCK